MGQLIDYFVADSRAEAATTIDWAGGPGQPPAKSLFMKSRQAYETLSAPGIEPVVILGQLEELLTGRTFEEQLQHDNLVAERDGGERLILHVPDPFVRAVTDASPDALHRLAEPWSQIEEFYGQVDAQVLQGFLGAFHALCRRATDADRHVYCWLSV